MRRVLWNSLTPEIEAKLDEILTTQTFQRYSHHVILQKVGGLEGLVNLEGINDYLELENERFEALQKFLKEEYLQLSSTRREWITESFRTALRNAPPESYLKARTLLGGEWLPERTPELDLEAKPPFPMQAAYMLLQYNTDTWENLGLPSRDIEALLAIKNANRETRMRYITARGPVRVDKMNQELRAIARGFLCC